MAPFNPDVPKVQPGDYTKTFAPISDVPGNKAWGTALSGGGQLFGAAVDIADTAMKKAIQTDVREQIDPIVANQTAALETLRNGAAGAEVAVPPPNPTDAKGVPNTATWASNTYGFTPKSAGPAVNILPENQPKDIPPALDNGLQKIGILPDALGQGKINDTYYTQQLTAQVTKLRAQYPGYREYIDEQVSQITGMTPANAYLRNMMEDINRNAQTAQASRNKVDTLAMDAIRDGNQSLIPVYAAFKAGRATELQMLTAVSEGNAKKWQFAQDKLEIENYNDNRTLQASKAKDVYTNLVNSEISTALKSYAITAGLDTATDAASFLAKVRSGEIKASDQQMVQLSQALAGAKDTVYNRLYHASIEPGRNGKSLADYMGNETRDGILKSGLGVYDVYQNAVTNKDFGTGVFTQKMAEAYQNQGALKILENKDIGPIVSTIGALNKTLGPQLMSSAFGAAILNGFDTKIGGAFKAFTSEKVVQSWEQPDSRASRGLGPRSLKADVEDAAGKSIAGNSGVYDDLLDNVSKISSKETPDSVKSAIIKYAFDSRNIGVIRNFNMEYKDPKSGVVVPGKLAAFTRLTSPDITEEVWRLSAKEPELWTNYQRWAETAFGADLFAEQIQNLNKLQDEKSIPIHVSWDSDKKVFSLLGSNGQPLKATANGGAVEANYVKYAYDTINQLNRGIQTLGRIQDVKNVDTGAYLLRVLSDAGYTPSADRSNLGSNPQSLPYNMFKALMQQDIEKNKPKKMEDTFKRSSTVSSSVDG